jgi:hypothetical protein
VVGVVQKFLDGERVLRELAEISVASMQCRGLKHPLFAPQNLIDKIKRKPNGKEDVLHYIQSANPPKVWEFTKFMATDIAICVITGQCKRMWMRVSLLSKSSTIGRNIKPT